MNRIVRKSIFLGVTNRQGNLVAIEQHPRK